MASVCFHPLLAATLAHAGALAGVRARAWGGEGSQVAEIRGAGEGRGRAPAEGGLPE
jgi:hypothetical protein